MKRKIFSTLAIVTGLLVTLVLISASVWPVLNRVETGATPEYSELLPQYFSADVDRVHGEAVASVEALDGWTLVSEDADTGLVRATTTNFGFVQDVEVRVQRHTDFATSVSVTSTSRVGKGDFGQNARNVRELQEELERRLGAVLFDPYATDASRS